MGTTEVSQSAFYGAEVEAFHVLQYSCLACITFLYYDHMITFPTEVDLIWRHKFSFVTVLFLLNRYAAFLGYLPIIVFIFNLPIGPHSDLCSGYGFFPPLLNCFSQVIILTLLVMRCYALYQRKLWILLITVPPALAIIGVSLWLAVKNGAESIQFGGLSACVLTTSSGVSDTGKVNVGTSQGSTLQLSPTGSTTAPVWLLPPVIFDMIVFGLTIIKTYRLNKTQKAIGIHSELVNLLMRDGSIYFAIMVAANLFNFFVLVEFSKTTSFLASPLLFTAQSMGNNSMLSHAVSVTSMSHLVLNLRDVNNSDPEEQTVNHVPIPLDYLKNGRHFHPSSASDHSYPCE